MSHGSHKKRRRGGNVRMRVAQAMKQQAKLENELQKLASAQDHEQCAKAIIDFVTSQEMDPLQDEENNPFKLETGPCSQCNIL